jgi:hypothetical protein
MGVCGANVQKSVAKWGIFAIISAYSKGRNQTLNIVRGHSGIYVANTARGTPQLQQATT